MQRLVSILAICALGACKDSGDDTADTAPAEAIAWAPVLEDAPQGAFLSAWGPDASDVWIVGGQPGQGAVLRGSGAEFVPVDLPAGTPLLDWVHGTSASDVWVGGVQGTLLHWDGSAWTDHGQDFDEAIWGIYCKDPDEAWAVGGESGFGGTTARALRWDGSAWSPLVLPEDLADLSNLFKVHHDGADLWMVGVGGVALKGDGVAMTQVATGTASDLVTANHPVDGGPMVVVGGRGVGVVLEAADGGLSVTTQANAGLNGVQVFPGGTAVVVGERGYTGLYDTTTDTLTDVAAITLDVLHAVWGTPGGTTYAVGGNLYTADDTFHGVILSAPSPE